MVIRWASKASTSANRYTLSHTHTNTVAKTKMASKASTSANRYTSSYGDSVTISKEARNKSSNMRSTLSKTADLIPGVSNVKSGIEAITGRDPITGNKLTKTERAISASGIILPGPAKTVAKSVSKISKGVSKADVEVTIPSNRYPETSKHIRDAQKAGHPDILTIDRSGAKSRRKDSIGGLNKIPGKDLDEYPPAMFKEGGKGASVRPINSSDNRGSGAYLGNKLRNYPDGTRVKIK